MIFLLELKTRQGPSNYYGILKTKHYSYHHHWMHPVLATMRSGLSWHGECGGVELSLVKTTHHAKQRVDPRSTWEYSDSTASSEFPAVKKRTMFSATTCAYWTTRCATFWFCVSATSPITNTVGYAGSASWRVGCTGMKLSDVRHSGASVRSGADIGMWPAAQIYG